MDEFRKEIENLERLLISLETYGDFGGLAQPVPSGTDAGGKTSPVDTSKILQIIQQALSTQKALTENVMQKVDKVAVSFNDMEKKLAEKIETAEENLIKLTKDYKTLESQIKLKLEEIKAASADLEERVKKQEEEVSEVLDTVATTLENLNKKIQTLALEMQETSTLRDAQEEIDNLKELVQEQQGQVEALKVLNLQTVRYLESIVEALEGTEEEEEEKEEEEEEEVKTEEENKEEEKIEEETKNEEEPKETGGKAAEKFGNEIDLNKVIQDVTNTIKGMKESE